MLHDLVNGIQTLWSYLTHTSLFGLLLTLVVYQLGFILYQRLNRPIILHPVATASVLIAIFLRTADLSYSSYHQQNQLIYFLLGPATVALAIPLYQQFHQIRKMALPILVTVIMGAIMASLSAVVIAYALNGSTTTILSLAPKSVTTPIAMGIADSIGGLTTLTTGVVVFTGVIGALMSPLVFYILRLHDPRHQGLVLGINAHGLGTARAFEVNPTSGAFASLAMGLTGAFTALTLPYAVVLWQNWH